MAPGQELCRQCLFSYYLLPSGPLLQKQIPFDFSLAQHTESVAGTVKREVTQLLRSEVNLKQQSQCGCAQPFCSALLCLVTKGIQIKDEAGTAANQLCFALWRAEGVSHLARPARGGLACILSSLCCRNEGTPGRRGHPQQTLVCLETVPIQGPSISLSSGVLSAGAAFTL